MTFNKEQKIICLNKEKNLQETKCILDTHRKVIMNSFQVLEEQTNLLNSEIFHITGVLGIITDYIPSPCRGCCGGKVFHDPKYKRIDDGVTCHRLESTFIVQCSECLIDYINRPLIVVADSNQTLPFNYEIYRSASISFPFSLPRALNTEIYNVRPILPPSHDKENDKLWRELHDRDRGQYQTSVKCKKCLQVGENTTVTIKYSHTSNGDDDWYCMSHYFKCSTCQEQNRNGFDVEMSYAKGVGPVYFHQVEK